MIALILFLLVLGVLVFIHELGHFIAAKKNGVKVEEFGLGYPPRAWGKKVGETLYSLNIIPLGGFVKVFGEEYHEEKKIDPEEKKRAFIYKKPWQKAVILVAGVTMNLILGVTIYYFLLGTNNFMSEPLPLIREYQFPFGEQQKNVLIAGVLEDTSAAEAGVTFGDVIYQIRVEGSDTYGDWTEVSSAESLIDTINQSEGETVYLDVRNVRDNEEKVVTVVPQMNEELGRAVIGISLIESVTLVYQSTVQKLFAGFMHSYNILAYNFSTLGSLISMSFETRDISPVSQSVAGPVGIFSLVSEITSSSGEKLVRNLLDFTALLSISLAFMNILPIPVLDGGRLMLVIYEWIARKPVNPSIERKLNLAGLAILLTLIVLVTFNDIYRLITN
jgi:regulator of sigma E protease